MKKTDKEKRYDKTIVIPVNHEMWKSLKQMAFDKETSMNAIARNAIRKAIKKHEK